MLELIVSRLVLFVSIPLVIAGIISIVWLDEPFIEPPDNINSESDGD
jgi:hypothetical protein